MVCGVVDPHFVIICLVVWNLLIAFLAGLIPMFGCKKQKKSISTEYYEYMLLYVDDCLAISENPKEAVLQLDKFFEMQPSSVAPPNLYLGFKVKKMRLPNIVEAWTFSSSQ